MYFKNYSLNNIIPNSLHYIALALERSVVLVSLWKPITKRLSARKPRNHWTRHATRITPDVPKRTA